VKHADDGRDEGLAEVFWSVARRLRHLTHETLEPIGITPGQSRAVAVLMRHGVMRLSELSDHLRIAPRSTTEVVDGLQERGLVERTPDPGDRRAVILRPTDEGRRIRAEIDAARSADSAELFARLPAADRDALARLLRTLSD
jgi:DNA-binding MarR family transcriptional regulator